MKRHRSTPAGEHRPVMLDEILKVADPRPGQVVVDCTLGWAGHSAALLQKIAPTGLLIGLDLDADNLPSARERLATIASSFHLVHGNFAALPTILAEASLLEPAAPARDSDEPAAPARESSDAKPLLARRAREEPLKADFILADLGMSSMQVDDAERGFSYRRDGSLDMRMDRTRGRTAAQLLQTISEADLSQALRELADEPQAETIAAAIVGHRQELLRTGDLARVIAEAALQTDWRLHPSAGRWNLHPAARTFQALRILVNRELGNLENLLRIAPQVLRPGGTVAIISFHSGEDRLVKAAFRVGKAAGVYADISADPLRATARERFSNPRSRSAKLRWARMKGGD